MISSPKSEILLKFLLNLITMPSNILSVIRVLEPAPKTKIFFYYLFFRKFTNSFKLFAL